MAGKDLTLPAGGRMYIETLGLVLREREYKESSRILTVLSSTEGKITVAARGAKRKGSRIAASTQLLTLSEMTLYKQKDRYILSEARTVELFRGLRDDVKKLALGSYFGELIESVTDEDAPNPEVLSLGLNALYALSEGLRPERIIKAGLELRLASAAGFEPYLECCSECGRETPESPVLSLTGGTIYCAACVPPEEAECVSLYRGTLDAMRYILHAEPKKMFSFSVGENTEKQLVRVCEAYLTTQLGRGFSTLDFYKSL